MYTQEHVDKLEREIQKANLLLIKVQSKWQQAQMSAAGTAAASGGGTGGASSTPRPDWEEARAKLSGLQLPRDASSSQQVVRVASRVLQRRRALHPAAGQVSGGGAGRRAAERQGGSSGRFGGGGGEQGRVLRRTGQHPRSAQVPQDQGQGEQGQAIAAAVLQLELTNLGDQTLILV